MTLDGKLIICCIHTQVSLAASFPTLPINKVWSTAVHNLVLTLLNWPDQAIARVHFGIRVENEQQPWHQSPKKLFSERFGYSYFCKFRIIHQIHFKCCFNLIIQKRAIWLPGEIQLQHQSIPEEAILLRFGYSYFCKFRVIHQIHFKCKLWKWSTRTKELLDAIC